MKIGDLGPWKIGAARKQAEEYRKLVDRGIDPLAPRTAAREEMDLGALWNLFAEQELSRASASHKRDISASWDRRILPHFSRRTKLQDLSQRQIQSFLDTLSHESGPIASNRCHSYLRRVLNFAVNEGFLDRNPAQGITRNPEHHRESYLTTKQMQTLFAALRTRRERPAAQAIALLAVTGCRKGEVLGMRWADIDLSNSLWVIGADATKQRRRHRIPLNETAATILRELKDASQPNDEFVFPSSSASGHLSDVRNEWRDVRKFCDIENFKLHDLRHTFASFLVSSGTPIETISQLLGHSQIQTTQRYAHLYDETLRAASASLADALSDRN